MDRFVYPGEPATGNDIQLSIEEWLGIFGAVLGGLLVASCVAVYLFNLWCERPQNADPQNGHIIYGPRPGSGKNEQKKEKPERPRNIVIGKLEEENEEPERPPFAFSGNPGKGKRRILCLLSGGASAADFKRSGMADLAQALSSNFELVYAQSPPGGLWIHDPPLPEMPVTDFDWATAAVTSLNDVVRDQGPFYGILGFSHGSAFATYYLSVAPAGTFHVAMLFCGYLPHMHEGLLKSIDDHSPFHSMRALIFMGAEDGVISNAMTEQQATKFTTPFVMRSSNAGHHIPNKLDAWFNIIVDFADIRRVPLAFFGNPGKGKSSLANCIAGEVLFPAGPSSGMGKTSEVTCKTNDKGIFVDTPGMADVDMDQRRASAEQITTLLKEGGLLRPAFVITDKQGRIHEEDKITMKIILDAAPQIGNSYAIIVNQCDPKLMRLTQDPAWKATFEEFLLKKLPSITEHIHYLPRSDVLNYEEDKFVDIDQRTRTFFEQIPVAHLTPGQAKDIVANDFHSIYQQLQMSNEENSKYQRKLAELTLECEKDLEEASVSRRRGISLRWVLDQFPKLEQFGGKSVMKMDFRQLAKLVAYGDKALGKGKLCPRDRKPDCSIVDAVHADGHSDLSSEFLSWVWAFSLETVIGALEQWKKDTHRTNFTDKDNFLWWCFYQNNQFRILGQGATQTTEDLAEIFGSQLTRIGRMLSLMDKIEHAQYLLRIWCVYEVFIAKQRDIPITIILPETARSELHAICLGGPSRIKRAIDIIDVEQAKASSGRDEIEIKRLIKKESSFEKVNGKVADALRESLQEMIFNAPETQGKSSCCCFPSVRRSRGQVSPTL